jgi:hypothetical protein
VVGLVVFVDVLAEPHAAAPRTIDANATRADAVLRRCVPTS